MTYRGHAVSIPAEKIRSKVMLNAQLLTRNATDAKQLDEWCNESNSSFLGFAGWGCVWSQPKRCRWELLQIQRSRLEQSLLVCSLTCLQADVDSENRGPASTEKYGDFLSIACGWDCQDRNARSLPKDVKGQKCQGNFTNSLLSCMAVPLERKCDLAGEISVDFGEALKERSSQPFRSTFSLYIDSL